MVLPDPNPYFNRDLSLLKFNERVLYQAQDSRVPLLERLRFLSIFSNNLDEFFMKRVGYLKRAASHSVAIEIREVVKKQIALREQTFIKVKAELAKNEICFEKWDNLSPEEQKSANLYFQNKVFPLLTPLAVDKSHPFPFLSNLSVSLGIVLQHPKKNETYFARVKIPGVLPQWVQIAAKSGDSTKATYRFISLLDLISENLKELYPAMIVRSVMPFRITRNANIAETRDDVEDRLDMVEEELRLRRIAKIVRFEHVKPLDEAMFKFLCDELELTAYDLYEVPGEVNYEALTEISNLNISGLRFPAHVPVKPLALREEGRDIFSIIREKDVLVHHPYESFNDSVERFVYEAVKDPNVLAIKITLYRAGENNPIIPLLIRAAEKGKQVVCVVELKARFDEARNIYWAEMLEEAGVHVVYGVLDKKIHCKTILVIRKEGDNYRFYSHIGTGNYNPNTAKLYTDLSLFTSDKKIGTELIEVFNFLTGLSLKKNYTKLLVAPVNMRMRFLQYIKKEIEFHKTEGNGHIIAKMNSLEDQEICNSLYEASQAGVRIELIVRGFCTLKPGIKGMSETISVSSVIGRFLEHSRIYYFRRGAKDPLEGKFYIGSADWMYRNLNNRIETIVPIEQLPLKEQCWGILQMMLKDRVLSWDLDSHGEYIIRKPDKSDGKGLHEDLIKFYLDPR